MAVFYVKKGNDWERATRAQFVRAQSEGLPTKQRQSTPGQYPGGKRRPFK